MLQVLQTVQARVHDQEEQEVVQAEVQGDQADQERVQGKRQTEERLKEGVQAGVQEEQE